MTTQDHDNTAQLLREALAVQLIIKQLRDYKDELTARLPLNPGERLNIETEWGESLGSYSRGKRSFEAVVADPQAVAAELKPEEVTFTLRVDTVQDLVEYLGAEGMTQFLSVVPDEKAVRRLAKDVLDQWRETGQVRPGWDIREKVASGPRLTPTNLAKDMAQNFTGQTIKQLRESTTRQLPQGKDDQ